MKISKENAQALWRERYGYVYYVFDFNGNLMCYDGYGDSNCYRTIWGKEIFCGWNIHHILPKSKGGTANKNNLACTNMITNIKAADKITYWIDNRKYQVQKNSNGYEIITLKKL